MESTLNTISYLIAGLVVVISSLALYIFSLVWRNISLNKQEKYLQESRTEKPFEG